MIGNSDDKNNFLRELLPTNRQDANLWKIFANNLSTDIRLTKTQLSLMIKSGGFLGRLLGLLLKTELPLMKNVIKPLAKSILLAGASTADSVTHKKSQDPVQQH